MVPEATVNRDAQVETPPRLPSCLRMIFSDLASPAEASNLGDFFSRLRAGGKPLHTFPDHVPAQKNAASGGSGVFCDRHT
jgi:hypothetical protein